jgi:hypothetical protein
VANEIRSARLANQEVALKISRKVAAGIKAHIARILAMALACNGIFVPGELSVLGTATMLAMQQLYRWPHYG